MLLGQSLVQIRLLSFKDFQGGPTLPTHPRPGHVHDTPSYCCCLYVMANFSEKLEIFPSLSSQSQAFS